MQRLALKSWLLNKVFLKTQMYVLNRDFSLDNTFRRLLDVSYHKDYDETLRQFGLSTEELDEKLEGLTDQLGGFASPLPYRDEFCEADIYVMK